MYDPKVVDTFVAIHHTVPVSADQTTEQREVMQQISRSRQVEPAATSAPAAAEPALGGRDDVLSFVSLARMASGSSGLTDVLALSGRLVRDIVPGAVGAWYVLEDGARLTLAGTFGEGADRCLPFVVVGDKLTGWVAANRQVIVNSDAALNLGAAAQAAPALRSCLSVPLLSGGTLAGVLSLYGSARDAFTDDHGRLVQMVAPHLAQAIESARSRQVEAPTASQSRELRLVASR